MARRKVSLAEVARQLGVHPSTVSRALDPARRSLIGDELVGRVRAVANQMGYRPDPIAASLRTRRSRLIGALVPDIANPVFSPIIGGLEETLTSAGWSLIVANAADEARRIALVDELAARRVDGMVLATAKRDDPVLRRCRSHRLPTVLVNRRDDRGLTSSVVSDDRLGMHLAVDHLVALGHRRIAHIAGPAFLSTGHLRREGFVAAMAAHGLRAGERAIVEASALTRDAGLIAAREILRSERPTAIVAANDLLALGVLLALDEAGLSCPADVSVTGHNDMPLVDQVTPPLTTIRISHQEMGRESGRILLGQIAHAQKRIERVLEPQLVVRRSTRPIAA